MRNIYDLTIEQLEDYFLSLGEKSLKQYNFIHGYIRKN